MWFKKKKPPVDPARAILQSHASTAFRLIGEISRCWNESLEDARTNAKTEDEADALFAKRFVENINERALFPTMKLLEIVAREYDEATKCK